MQKHDQWLLFARDDLDLAKLAESENTAIIPATYHTQQCAEKALKAYLAFMKQPIKKTHDLVALVHVCSDFDEDFLQLLPEAESLNPFVTRARYPDDLPFMIDKELLLMSIKEAERILMFVEERI